MDAEKIKNFFHNFWHVISIVFTAILGFLFIRRGSLSSDRDRANDIRDEHETVKDKLDRIEKTSNTTTELLDGAKADISELGKLQSEARETTDNLAGNLDRQSELIEESERIFATIRERHEKTENQ